MAEYKRSETLKFVNPYNFVSVDKKKDVRAAVSRGNNTGVLHCELMTKTPLAIPDTEKVVMKENHPTYPFMSLDGKPFIPGSSIRGVLRSVYETLTNSCLVTFDKKYNDNLTERVAAKEPYKPGILIKTNGKWKLYSARRILLDYKSVNVKYNENGERYIEYNGNVFKHGEWVCKGHEINKKGKIIWKELRKYDVESGNEKKEYIIFVGEPFDNKKYESVFKKDKEVKSSFQEISDAIERLEYSLSVYNNDKINKCLNSDDIKKKHSGYMNYEAAKKKGVIPVWYSNKIGKTLYLSPACIGRKTYKNKVSDLIGENLYKCKSRESLCPACRLFGMISKDDSGNNLGSRVRVTDAMAVGGKYTIIDKVTLKELSSPRTTYPMFYAKVQNKKENYDSIDAEIMGRKFYWHNPKAANNKSCYSTSEKTERNSTCELVDKNSKFKFDIFYENLTNDELKQLIWVASLGENIKDGEYCYKLGHGKPLGLGSVKIIIKSQDNREWTEKSGYNVISKEPENTPEFPDTFDKDIKKELYKICDYRYWNDKKTDVRYPYVVDARKNDSKKLKENILAGHAWYGENKKTGNRLIGLSDALKSEDFIMPAYELTKAKSQDYK